MAVQVVAGATTMCTFGVAPSTLVVLPQGRVLVGGMPAANIMDHLPTVNIPPYGMCTSLANPAVASATAAALGVLTPMPCVPMTATPWAPGSPTVSIASQPALNNTSTCSCPWGGLISIVVPGQTQVMVP